MGLNDQRVMIRHHFQKHFAGLDHAANRENLQVLRRPRNRRGHLNSPCNVARHVEFFACVVYLLPDVQNCAGNFFVELMLNLVDLEFCFSNLRFSLGLVGDGAANYALKSTLLTVEGQHAAFLHEVFF